jgi:hypothetical protein
MTVRHRRWHLWIWVVLTPIIVGGLTVGCKGITP